MLDLGLIDEVLLRRVFGPGTVVRGTGYATASHVLSIALDEEPDGTLAISGKVEGSRAAPYSTTVWVFLDPQDPVPYVDSSCTCPVGEDCKHAVALLLVAQRQQASAVPAWERQLDLLLDELESSAPTAPAQKKPLALQVQLSSPPRGNRYGPSRGTLSIRPLQRGARDNWIKTGVGWKDVPLLQSFGAHRRDQSQLLAEILTAYRAVSSMGYYGSENQLTLSSFGPSLWPLLARAEQAGIELVPGQGLDEVVLEPEPVAVQIDVNTAEDRGLRVHGSVLAGGERYAQDAFDLLGVPGHGVAVWRPGQRSRSWSLRLAPLSSPVGPEVRRLLLGDRPLQVPDERRDELVSDYLPRIQRHVPVVSSDQSVVLAEPAEPRLALSVTWVAVDEVGLRWSWRYRVGADDRVYGLRDAEGTGSRRSVRRPLDEQALLDDLVLTGDAEAVLCDGGHRRHGLLPEQTLRHGRAIRFAEDVLPDLAAAGRIEIDETGGRPDYREAREAPVVHFASMDSGVEADRPGEQRTDWLDLEVVISVDGRPLALAQLLTALTAGQDRVILPDGVHIAVDRPEFSQLAELVAAAGELVEQPDGGVRVGGHDLGMWDELAEIGVVDAQAGEWVRAAQALRGLTTLPQVEPTGVKAELRGYQLDGFRWLAFLWGAQLGGILADDMGLGKTLQTLALVAHARELGAGPFLVVAPTTVVSTWAHEAASFTPGLVVRTVTESHARRGMTIAELAEDADVLITSYTLFRLEVDAYRGCDWGGLVLDEAQAVKNHHGKTYQCVRRLDVPFRLALTGTPMENRLLELWSLLSIVAPGLYPWPQRFVETVANPVERLGEAAVLERFRRRIRPFLLRRTKEYVAADLPPKQEQVLDVRLTPKHRRIYDTHLQRERQTVLGLVGDFDRHRIAIFRSLTRMRQLSLDAALVDEKYDGVGSAKADVLVDHLLELVAEGHRALVFSQFTSYLGRVRARLDREGIETVYLDGRTRQRGKVVSAFKDGDAPVFLISLKAGGVGLTLTEADYVFVLDPWWNPAVEAQAVDRTHRIGQTRPVMVYRLVAVDTIEQKVMELKARKQQLFAQVVDGGGAASAGITAEDVRALFEG
ncbi:MAG TPA: DEAD/DEAH box helicase [Nocardioidaceae bacterium]|nr:DEAD/DEAH box helicase [Nocardioidaceae bacterium]